MTGYAVFQMWEPFRQSLIKRHQFYVEQAQKRLLSQFENMEPEADKAGEEWLEESGRYFDPDRHDPGDFYEAANDVRIEFYELLSDMREQTRLSVVAGMFHDWDKQLREWLVREIMRSFPGSVTAAKIWSVKFDEIAALLEGFGWNVRSADYFRLLDACRLVVNVYKHGKGQSFDELKSRYPEHLADPFDAVPGVFPKVEFRDHRHLKVTDAQFQAFSDAILRFWRNVPENTFDTQITEVPDWFGKAIMRDREDSKNARKTGRTGLA